MTSILTWREYTKWHNMTFKIHLLSYLAIIFPVKVTNSWRSCQSTCIICNVVKQLLFPFILRENWCSLTRSTCTHVSQVLFRAAMSWLMLGRDDDLQKVIKWCSWWHLALTRRLLNTCLWISIRGLVYRHTHSWTWSCKLTSGQDKTNSDYCKESMYRLTDDTMRQLGED